MSERSRPEPAPSGTWIDRAVSALNGAVGDHLARRGNGLAIRTAFFDRGRPLALEPAALTAAHPRLTGKLCLLVHGLGCSESVWTFPEGPEGEGATSFGHLLARDLGYTPFFLRYNSGQPVADSGAQFARLIDELTEAYPVRVREIVLIGHSMGGLVIQGAARSAARRRRPWLELVRHVFYLGTPHDGADLERLAHAASAVLRAVPNPITRLVGDVIDVRSQGIKDLRRGHAGEDVEEPAAHPPRDAGGWLGNAQHHLISGTLTEDPRHLATIVFGDGLVRHPRWHQRRVVRPFTPSNVKVFPGVHHLALACHPEVYDTIRQWCAEA